MKSINQETVFEAVKNAPVFEIAGTTGNGGTVAAISWQFGISGTSKAVSEALVELEKAGKIKGIQTYTDRIFYI